jgi:hypothetical protein
LRATRYGKAASGQHGRFLQGRTDGPALQLGEQLIGWTPAMPTLLAAKTPSRYLYPSEGRGYDSAHRSLQSALLLPTVRTAARLLFSLLDCLLERFTHRRLPGFLDLFFHLG